ncbi:adhesion G-protein coupled receptor D1-like isoform X2 [Dendronephthya gigantea]|uniref:adhesion G-protein coupled receptor D1-like isoform X2 n=1 Tax=Dendronephthya gigantea TaxID=151771 RepID=UPI00106A9FEF|nr:adhesion G-protein coupled receptor D1-like isoform X2 [Dendronephthya gigantea]
MNTGRIFIAVIVVLACFVVKTHTELPEKHDDQILEGETSSPSHTPTINAIESSTIQADAKSSNINATPIVTIAQSSTINIKSSTIDVMIKSNTNIVKSNTTIDAKSSTIISATPTIKCTMITPASSSLATAVLTPPLTTNSPRKENVTCITTILTMPTPSPGSSSRAEAFPTTTSSSTKASNTESEIATKLNAALLKINNSEPKAFEKIVNVTVKILKEVKSNVTNDSLVIVAPLLEKKLVEYAVANKKKLSINGSIDEKNDEFDILLMDVERENKSTIMFPEPENESTLNNDIPDFIVVPVDLSSTEKPVFVGILFHDLSNNDGYVPVSDQKDSTKHKLASKIISATIDPKPTGNMDNINFTLTHRNKAYPNYDCAFVNESNGNFSMHGCSLNTTKANRTQCTCNHTTSFAVLIKIDDKSNAIEDSHRKALSLITYIGVTLSLIGETLTVGSYVLLIGLNTEQAHLHTNLALSLGVAQIFFLAGMNASTNQVACLLVTALLHYFYLATFCWMLVEGFHLYLMVVKVFTESSYLRQYYLFSWITPLIIVGLALIAAAASPNGVGNYINDGDICWISQENNYIWFFVGPVLLVCLANLVLLVLVVQEMTRMGKTKGGGPSLQLRKSVKACLLLFPILGTSWLFCVILMLDYSLVVEYIFNILNSLQGFFIFLFYVLRSSEIRNVLQQRKARWATSLDLTNHPSTFQKTTTATKKSHPTSASSIKPIIGSWISPSPNLRRTPSPVLTRSSQCSASLRSTPSPRNSPTPEESPRSLKKSGVLTTPDHSNSGDLFVSARRTLSARSIKVAPQLNVEEIETST